MRTNLKAGDKITTIGGLVGKVLRVGEDDITVEIGADKSKMTFKKWAVGTVESNTSEIE